MTRFFIAVTYDVCEHNQLYEHMNEYRLGLDLTGDIDMKIKDFAKKDAAPVVKLYESATSDFKEFRLHREYNFKEYECRCDRFS
ncbi:hypothetical protein [Halobacillus sp. B23F22_1]|uniref:hypothetical protein n=1 Tax=Halobacillus sp. B23F22_1 TaxID=3459514 RepID=UPI00373E7422